MIVVQGTYFHLQHINVSLKWFYYRFFGSKLEKLPKNDDASSEMKGFLCYV
ncbi:hypothetical protein [Litchfieldia alkalitelluris]|uniref:hypothetical protein n=1 Tax=Litchfieldia alkalitelluris TaxID=304268 RepID=UPI001957B427|nr:hypothetical protein [Litchfieldia alkalitelluris]